jgi:membrane protein
MGAARVSKSVQGVTEVPVRLWSRGGLTWTDLGKRLWVRSLAHDLLDRAGLLSFYLLLSFFPLLIFLSSLTGILLSSQTETYWRLLNYVAHLMPTSAFSVFNNFLTQIKLGASGGKLSFGLIASLWTASSGIAALMEALDVAFEVATDRSWWRRRLIAILMTLGIGALLAVSLLFLFATSSAGAYITAQLPLLGRFGRLSNIMQWLVDALLLSSCLTVVYAFGPNRKRKSWAGILPGVLFALVSWCAASWGLQFYLSRYGSLTHSYGSFAGVIALLLWLYASSIAILLGGEFNAIIWMKLSSTVSNSKQERTDP